MNRRVTTRSQSLTLSSPPKSPLFPFCFAASRLRVRPFFLPALGETLCSVRESAGFMEEIPGAVVVDGEFLVDRVTPGADGSANLDDTHFGAVRPVIEERPGFLMEIRKTENLFDDLFTN